MPIFEYRCEKCGEVAEVLVRPGEVKTLKCPRCGSSELKRLFSSFGCGSGNSAAGCGGASRFT